MVERLMLFLAVGGPLMGLIAGMLLGAHERHSLPKMIGGMLFGALATVAYGMWRAYGSITNFLGLGSVANLGLQLTVFMVLGIILGAIGFRISNMLKRKLVN